MSNLIKTETYVKSDSDKNNNKFWKIELCDDNSITTRWGRIGDDGDSKSYPFGSQDEAQRFWDKKVHEKTRDGRNGEIAYRKLDVVGNGATSSSSNGTSVSGGELTRIATSQIKTNNKIVEDLIKYLTKVNVHNIVTASEGAITYNDSTGLFSTPLGIITQSAINEANNLLISIGDAVAAGKYDSKLKMLTDSYLMIVPTNFGRNRLDIHDFWSDLSKVQYQNGILDSLRASYENVVSGSKTPDASKVPEKKVFDCQLFLVEDGETIDRISSLYKKTRQSIHTCHKLNVKRVFKVEINTVKEAWENYGSKMDNIWELWHGTTSSNVLSVLKSGLRKPTKTTSNVTGRMFSGGRGSEGLYFSDQSTKSLGYSFGYWNNTRNDVCYMFLCSVAMGKFYVPNSTGDGPFPHFGYESTFAKAHTSGVHNNEMIVYKESMCNLNYLIEFS